MANVHTYLARANVALSVTLTAVSCLAAVLTTPLALAVIQAHHGESTGFRVPFTVHGPWTLQSEYGCTFMHDAVFPASPPPAGIPRGTLFYQTAYVELLYFVTGEHQPYDRKKATFDRVIPLRNFSVWNNAFAWGAWQVGVRYAYLDLQDKGVNGATLHDMVLGLNWFLNPNMKIQWNFAVDHREPTPGGSAGWTYIFGTRLALDF